MNIRDIFAKNGLVIQQESYTCGPCSLLNVLRLKGDASHSELEVAERCNAKPGIGASHEDMVRVAQELGLTVIEDKLQATIKDIEQHIDTGACVIVNFIDQYSGNGHYAVIAEHDDRAFYLRDCTSGFFRFEKQFFVKSWHSSDDIPQWYMAISLSK